MSVRSLLLPCVVLFAAAASGVPVTIDPNGYAGEWALDGIARPPGAVTVDLVPGRHRITQPHSVYFDVDAAGNIAVIDADSADGAPNRLTWRTFPVAIDPGAYTGPYRLVLRELRGPQSLVLPVGLLGVTLDSGFQFRLQRDGNISVLNGVSATGGLQRLTFNTATISVDPGRYAGPYSFWAGGHNDQRGARSFVTVAGLPTRFHIGEYIQANVHMLTIHADGTIASTHPGGAYDLSGATIRFRNADVAFAHGDYDGAWSFAAGPRFRQSGSATYPLVPATRYAVGASTAGTFFFDLDASGHAGNVSPAVAATAGGATIAFNTRSVAVDPGQHRMGWAFEHVPSTRNATSARLMPGIGYYFITGTAGLKRVALDDAGHFVTSEPSLAANGRVLIIKSVRVSFDTGAFNGAIGFDPGGWFGTQRLFDLAPDSDYAVHLQGIGGATFRVASGCSVTPSSRAIGPYTVTATCLGDSVPPPSVVTNRDVSGAWRFEQSPADSSSYAHAGAFAGQPLWDFGPRGWFARFGGTSHLRVANHPALEPQMLTVEGWIRHAGHPGHYQYILAKGARSGCGSATWALNTEGDGGLRVRLGNYRLGADRASIDIKQDPTFVEGGCSGNGCRKVFDGEWHHVAFTSDGRELRFYVDGRAVTTATGISAAPLYGYALGYDMPGHNDLTIGAYDGDSCDLPFRGDVDEVRVWSRALSAAEVAARANGEEVAEETCAAAAATIADPAVAGAWNFDEAPHADAVDSATHGLHGVAGTTTGRDDSDPYKLCGTAGRAARFNGSHFVRVPYAPQLEPRTLSLETWFRGTTRGYLISKGGSAGCEFPSYTLTGVSGEGIQFGIRDRDRAYASPAASFAALHDGAWHHLLGTYDGHVLRLYLDGAEVGSGRAAENVEIFYTLGAHRDLTIGQLQNGSCTMGVEADLDGVRVWSRALTAEEAALRFRGLEPPHCVPPTIGEIPPVVEGSPITLGGVTHTFRDDGVYTVAVTLTSGEGCSVTRDVDVTVTNAAPVITAASVVATTQATGTVHFTDAGADDTHTVVWSWGDGTTSSAATHVYAAAGIYRVQVTVTDDDGASTTADAGTVVIVDQERALTGGGRIGDLQFTVEARYLHGALTGRANFRIGNTRYDSTSLDWLVARGGVATLQGSGPGFAFTLTATDAGNADRIHLRIWNPATGAVLHETANALLNGNVTVH
ncbi:MAG TPA: LamG-like jellyroll fold domain-containing protein [Thermoanaerobaculia bacterium]